MTLCASYPIFMANYKCVDNKDMEDNIHWKNHDGNVTESLEELATFEFVSMNLPSLDYQHKDFLIK